MYKAIVTKIRTRPLPGADRLQIGQCGQYQVVVGIDVKDGDLGVFLETDGQLSEELAKRNDLVRRKNEDGTAAGGMFEESRRVKSIKLRGARSDGFWFPVSMLSYAGDVSSLKEGDQFDEFCGFKICNKYETPATKRAQGAGRRSNPRKENPMFAKHIETGMFKREFSQVPIGSMIYVTEKFHGSSGRVGHVLVDAPIKRGVVTGFFSRLLGLPKTKKQWAIIIGSRNVVIGDNHTGFYGAEKFRLDAAAGISPRKGEVIYGEIVGYTETGVPIMANQNNESMKESRIKKQYGSKMEYRYGCLPSQCKFFVYRITSVNEDGFAVELPWTQVKKRCLELGLNTVPELARFVLESHLAASQWAFSLTEQEDGLPLPSTLDSSHIREGVVVRAEGEFGTTWLKNKSFAFGCLEGYAKESDDFVDTEEAA